MALRTTVVGSWWKLDEHEEQLARYHRGELSNSDGEDLLNRAAAASIAERRELGLDEWTGGAGCFDSVDRVTRGIHICNGNFKGRPMSAIVRNAPWVPVLQHLDGVIDIAALECSYFAECPVLQAKMEHLAEAARSF